MTDYRAPLSDMSFVLQHLAGLDALAALPGCEAAEMDLVEAVLGEAGRLAAEVVAPLNRTGDLQGSVLENGAVRTPDGFREAYRRFVDGGWNALPFDPGYGGQGLPWCVAMAVQEMWQSANMAFALCPLLNQGAVDALQTHGTPAQKALYLPRMISGAWTGTMNLTEPQAGSDVGAARTRAEPDGDRYRIVGQKVFITYGDHDLAENIVHLVLARLPDAPAGTKGLSLFLVPKILVDADGTLGPRNDVRCARLEHKLGIHASPTALMAYGEDGGAVGYLLGEENRGMACMFTMMNNARLSVGLQGLAVAERAYQQARAYALERVQGRDLTQPNGPVTIVHHPDVRRMLLSMKARIEAMRALAYVTAADHDRARRAPNAAERARHQRRVDLLTPVIKAWCTDQGCAIASTALQVHGGMGYVEETGVAQHYRDARIAPIYEGTNGIQAMDLLTRKVVRDEGAAMDELLADVRCDAAALAEVPGDDAKVIRHWLTDGADRLERATGWMVETSRQDLPRAAAGAEAFLHLTGTVAAGALLAKAAVTAARLMSEGTGDERALEAKVTTARHFADTVLSQSGGLAAAATRAGASVLAIAEDQL
jgi:alkylation response protein AidB-like acyl-CoA dehydrogenase